MADDQTVFDHDPCCSSHGVPMTCERYRRTHFVEVRPCCKIDRERLDAEADERRDALAQRLARDLSWLGPWETYRPTADWILSRLSVVTNPMIEAAARELDPSAFRLLSTEGPARQVQDAARNHAARILRTALQTRGEES